jgi:hypothetical protein
VTNVRPPGARPHRCDERDADAPVPVLVPALAKKPHFASPAAAVGLPLAVIAARLVGGFLDTIGAPPIGVAAILVIVFLPLTAIAGEDA